MPNQGYQITEISDTSVARKNPCWLAYGRLWKWGL